jgi:hypothetical protein
MSDPLGSDPTSFKTRSVDGCEFRDFSNYTYFGTPEFAVEYLKFKG